MTILANHYVLAVHDLESEAAWYCNVLGFEAKSGADSGWKFLQRDNCMVMLGVSPDALSPREIDDHSYFAYFNVDDVEVLYQRARNHEAEVWHEIRDQPWGMREFALVTPGGHRVAVGQEMPALRS